MAVWALRDRYRAAARAGNWETGSLIVTQLYRHRLEGQLLAELIYADGYGREHGGETHNARRCYELAASKSHATDWRYLNEIKRDLAV